MMPQTIPMLQPALALVSWTMIMWIWMYATRVPAMTAAGLDPKKVREKKELDVLPRSVRQVADNYNHLHEQPVLFYVLVFYCHLSKCDDAINIRLAWMYVYVRIIHSIYQALINDNLPRFVIFAVGTLALMGMTVRCILATSA